MTDTVDQMPEYPQTLSIADVDYANTEKPNTWTIEHFECWQREQVARENVRVLRRHIKELRQAMSQKSENDDTKSECVADLDEISILLAKEGLEIYRAIDVAAHIAGMFGQAEKQEPIGEIVQAFGDLTAVSIPEMPPVGAKLYTQPAPQREWVGLTDDEIDYLDRASWYDDHKSWDVNDFARAIEAKLKEKNAYGWQSVANPTEFLDDLRGGADE
jgi:hypothetical protein